MARVGGFLSSEELGPNELDQQAKTAQDPGFHALWISDNHVCRSHDRKAAVRNARRLSSTDVLPGELAQALPQVAHFEQAGSLVPEDAVAEHFVCGDDPDESLRQLASYFK